MRFTYTSGQRPLDGYTIKRGIGQGGFGEVYYAVSDGGKEVALKLLVKNVEIDLRGNAHCLNCKHPNLVHLYDISEDKEGNHWVVMEYVAGETLSTVLGRHPHGLEMELAQKYFLEFCKAIEYLHDKGLFHRDLKPGNIFIEDGHVKVGDYGLCKFLNHSQGAQHTQSIGTVYYMAPEIGTESYGKSIDIYAAGVLLYEMLTGQVPFDGDNAFVILEKHRSSLPDMSKVPEMFRPVVMRALAKNPHHRHATMGELAREVAALGQRSVPANTPAVVVPTVLSPASARGLPTVLPVTVPVRSRLEELARGLVLAALLAGMMTLVGAAFFRTSNWLPIGRCFALVLAGSWAMLLANACWIRRTQESLTRRGVQTAIGCGLGLLAMWLDGYELPALLASNAQAASTVSEPTKFRFPLLRGSEANQTLSVTLGYLAYFGLAFFFLRWWTFTDRRRTQRFAMSPLFVAALLGLILMIFWSGPQAMGVATLAMIALIVQLASPWEPPAPARPRRLRLPGA